MAASSNSNEERYNYEPIDVDKLQYCYSGNDLYTINEDPFDKNYFLIMQHKIKIDTITKEDKPIGEGSFGTVYKGKSSVHNEDVTIKIIKYTLLKPNDRKLLDNEIEILKKICHIGCSKYFMCLYYVGRTFTMDYY